MTATTNTTNTPYMRIKDACTATGLSQFYLRNGCKDGSIPAIRSGSTWYINVPALLEKLDKQSRGSGYVV